VSGVPQTTAYRYFVSKAVTIDAPASVARPTSTSAAADVGRAQSVPPHRWLPGGVVPIKHIPKSARATCASHMATLLRSVVSNPRCVSNWVGLFNWTGTVLHPPKRGGRRHN